MARFPSTLTGRQLQRLAAPSSDLVINYPHAYRVIKGLERGRFRITEIDIHRHAIWIKLGIPANLFIYHRSGKVLIQGAIYERGTLGIALKKVLPANAIWQVKS